MAKHYEDFFKLLKDYYPSLNDACIALDNNQDDYDEEQLRLALHTILDAIDNIDDSAFWSFINGCRKKEV